MRPDVVCRTTAMASEVVVRARPLDGSDDRTRSAVRHALRIFADVDRTCTRFSPASDLMRANARGDEWVPVHRFCFDALVEAYAAYRRTDGRFDPRVLNDLVRLGYAESWTKVTPHPDPARALLPRPALPPWQPTFRAETAEVQVGPHPVDLGGIGKGLAVRWAGQRLHAHGVGNFVISAGGDVVCGGVPCDAPAWRASVEDPRGGTDPVAVVELHDEAVATSSVRLRSWSVGRRHVHHLIDPATGAPGGDGLLAVTTVDADAARAEVWSKVLFLTGRLGIAATAELFHLPALWVDVDGAVTASSALSDRLIWTAS